MHTSNMVSRATPHITSISAVQPLNMIKLGEHCNGLTHILINVFFLFTFTPPTALKNGKFDINSRVATYRLYNVLRTSH